jgi:hypothetical protein
MRTGTSLALLALLIALSCVALWSFQIRQVDKSEIVS